MYVHFKNFKEGKSTSGMGNHYPTKSLLTLKKKLGVARGWGYSIER